MDYMYDLYLIFCLYTCMSFIYVPKMCILVPFCFFDKLLYGIVLYLINSQGPAILNNDPQHKLQLFQIQINCI